MEKIVADHVRIIHTGMTASTYVIVLPTSIAIQSADVQGKKMNQQQLSVRFQIVWILLLLVLCGVFFLFFFVLFFYTHIFIFIKDIKIKLSGIQYFSFPLFACIL